GDHAMAAGPPDEHGTITTGPSIAAPPKAEHARACLTWPPMPPSRLARSRYPMPRFPAITSHVPPISAGVIEPRSRSARLSASQLAGANRPIRRKLGESAVTESDPSYGADVAPLPALTKTVPSGAMTGPPGAHMPP